MILGPRSKSTRSRPKIGSHLASTVARHLSEEMMMRPPCTSRMPTIAMHRFRVRLPPYRASAPSKVDARASPSPSLACTCLYSLPSSLHARAQMRPPLSASQAPWPSLIKPPRPQPSVAPAPLHPTSPSSIHAAPPPPSVAEQPPPPEQCRWCCSARPSWLKL